MFNLIDMSTCYYLFGEQAEKIFDNIKIKDKDQKRKFVDQCLELLIRIHIFILSHKDGFFLVDPMSHTDQCHLYSFKVAQIKKSYRHQIEEEKLARTEDNRFLHLALFLSHPFISQPSLLISTVMKSTREKISLPKRHFLAFLRDEGRCREQAARKALSRLFEQQLKNQLITLAQKSPLHTELAQLAHEELPFKKKLYVYPKLAGVAYLIDRLAQENMAFIIKLKVLTREGHAGTIAQASQEVKEEDPVLVFEGLITDGSYSLSYYREEAKRCPHFFYHHVESNKRHRANEICFACRKVDYIDLQPYQERLRAAMSSPNEMLYALGANFMIHTQEMFIPFFQDKEKYPHLSGIFERAAAYPLPFSVCHVHPDSAAHAFSSGLILDSSPEELLEKRGVS